MPQTQKPTLLVTGAAGFIGSQMVQFASSRYSIISVDQSSHFTSRPEHRSIPFGTQVDRNHLFEWLEKNRPTLAGVVHLGACADTTEMRLDYLQRVNVEYSQNIWKYCTEHKIPLAYASSAATYGEGENGYDDNEATLPKLRPLNPYGASKHQFDIWALEQERQGRCPPSWAGFKFFNVYGFGERHKGKMSSVIIQAYDQILAQGRVRLFRSHKADVRDGEQKRDFIFVKDVVDVLMNSIEKPIHRGIFNLGSGQARTFLDLVRCVFRELGRPEDIEWVDTPVSIRDRYQYFTQATMGKLRANGYTKEFHSLEEGVKKYVQELERNSTS